MPGLVLALRERSGELLGVMEASWPEPFAAFTTEIRQRLAALAAGCARVVGARLAHGDLAAAQPKPAVYTLLDGLADSVLVVRAIRDDAGQVTDFSIEHVSPGFRDPAGRTGSDLTGLTLLEAYPASVSGQGLFARARQVLADGVAQHVPGPLSASLASGLAGPTPARAGRGGAGGPARGPVLRRRDLHLASRRAGRTGWPRSLITRSGSAVSAAGRRTSSPAPYAGPIRPSSCSAWRRARERRYRWPTCTAT